MREKLKIGSEIPCAVCAVPIVVWGGLQRYCADCKREIILRTKRECEANKRRAEGVREFGDTIRCAHCGVECRMTNGQQRYCDPCSLEKKKEVHRAANKKYDAARPARVRDPEQAKARHLRHKERRPEAGRIRAARYNEKHREIINEKARQFRLTEERKRWSLEWDRKHRQIPKNALNLRMSTAVRRYLKLGKGGTSWRKLVNFSIEELSRHIERQFVEGMSWENMSDWHIDHIVPLSSFEFSEASDPEFKAAWALTNLRPLWGPDNLSKHARRTHLV